LTPTALAFSHGHARQCTTPLSFSRMINQIFVTNCADFHHGLLGQWQEDLKDIFAPHFHYVPIKYKSYRWFGFTKMICEPWVLAGFIALFLYLRYRGEITKGGALILIVIGLTIAWLSSPIRRHLTLAVFKRSLTQHALFGNRVHIIAHSFGTYLTGMSLKNYADLRAANIVLTGCVLSRTWDWEQLLLKWNPLAFLNIRNEVSGRDKVPLAACYAQKLVPGLGVSGALGFGPDGVFVHTVNSPNLPCPQCSASVLATVHNMFAPHSGHSTAFIDAGYAARYWLPFLWDIDPLEYGEFLELCISACDFEEKGAKAKRRIIEGELCERDWKWAGVRLGEYIETEIAAHPRFGSQVESVGTLVTLTLSGGWKTVGEASAAAVKKDGDWMPRARGLNPLIAVTNAVDAALI
jgi:hypothetical protein